MWGVGGSLKVTLHEEVHVGKKELCWVCRCLFLRTCSLQRLEGVSEFSLHRGVGWGRQRPGAAPEAGCWLVEA